MRDTRVMEIRQLEYFIAVAEEGGFSRGADRVHVVQSAVSTAIAKLEHELDVRLVNRAHHQVTLTPAGAAFLAEAKDTLASVRRARNAVAQYRQQLSGTVDLGIHIATGPLDVPAALSRFHTRYPLVSVRLRQSAAGTTGHLTAVADGSFDLALVTATKAPAQVTLRPLAHEPLVLLCRPDHRLATQNQVAVSDLVDETLVKLAGGWGIRRLTDDALAAEGITPRAPYEAASYDTVAGLIRNRLGIALIPVTEASRFPDLRAIPVAPAIIWTLALAISASMSPAATALADALLAETRPPGHT
jgi:DNA-binding transcriptional LysR family regulator